MRQGIVSPGSGSYSASTNFTATPRGNNLFIGWMVDGQSVGFGNSLAPRRLLPEPEPGQAEERAVS